jgi:hypothetical protein
VSGSRIGKPISLTKAERDAALAKLRETFGGPPPEEMLRRARERANARTRTHPPR